MTIRCCQPLCKPPCSLITAPYLGSCSFFQNPQREICRVGKDFRCFKEARFDSGGNKRKGGVVCGAGGLLPVDPWAPNIDSESIASQLFAFSLFPYLGFLYFISKSKSAPKLTLFGFYFLLTFVGATIPAGIYAKLQYGTSLSNVDWLHGGAESLLTLTNIFIVLGLRQALRDSSSAEKTTSNPVPTMKQEKKSSI